MQSIPAVCGSCGTVFPGFTIGGDGNARIRLSNVGVPCPTCGGMGIVQSGTFELVSGALHQIAGSGLSPNQLRRLADFLQRSQQRDTSPQAVAERIETETPELGAFAAWIRQYLIPKNSGEVTGMISMILGALSLMVALMPQNEPQKRLSEAEVSAIVEKAVTAALIQTSGSRAAPVAARADAPKGRKKIGRNDPCPCRSGKKYKMCCISRMNQPAR